MNKYYMMVVNYLIYCLRRVWHADFCWKPCKDDLTFKLFIFFSESHVHMPSRYFMSRYVMCSDILQHVNVRDVPIVCDWMMLARFTFIYRGNVCPTLVLWSHAKH